MKRSKKFLVASILALGLTTSALTASGAYAETRQITVSAEGKVSVTPDAVRIYATVSLVRTTSKIALESANSVSAKVRAAFLANGVDRKEIRTQSVTVYPEYNYSQERGSTLIGYRASQSFDVVVKNAAKSAIVANRGISRIIEASSKGLPELAKTMTVTTLTAKEKAAFRDAAQPAVKAYIVDTFGKEGEEMLGALQQAVEAASK